VPLARRERDGKDDKKSSGIFTPGRKQPARRGGALVLGDQEGSGLVARALDDGDLAFEDDWPRGLAEALAAVVEELHERLLCPLGGIELT
jgi:hypothetical protein